MSCVDLFTTDEGDGVRSITDDDGYRIAPPSRGVRSTYDTYL